jgi:hypothetical protein
MTLSQLVFDLHAFTASFSDPLKSVRIRKILPAVIIFVNASLLAGARLRVNELFAGSLWIVSSCACGMMLNVWTDRELDLEESGRAIGFGTMCDDSQRNVAALVGYDETRPDAYRALVGTLLRRSLDENRLLFLSTGVAAFKRQRGAREVMEYEAFDVGHLPAHRKLPWLTMKAFLDLALRHMDTGAI